MRAKNNLQSTKVSFLRHHLEDSIITLYIFITTTVQRLAYSFSCLRRLRGTYVLFRGEGGCGWGSRVTGLVDGNRVISHVYHDVSIGFRAKKPVGTKNKSLCRDEERERAVRCRRFPPIPDPSKALHVRRGYGGHAVYWFSCDLMGFFPE